MFSKSPNSEHKRLRCLQAFGSCLQHINNLTGICILNELQNTVKINVKCLFGFSLQALMCPKDLA